MVCTSQSLASVRVRNGQSEEADRYGDEEQIEHAEPLGESIAANSAIVCSHYSRPNQEPVKSRLGHVKKASSWPGLARRRSSGRWCSAHAQLSRSLEGRIEVALGRGLP